MEEEGGDDSEMIDAMENWDSEDQDEEGHKNKKKGEDPVADWDRLISKFNYLKLIQSSSIVIMAVPRRTQCSAAY